MIDENNYLKHRTICKKCYNENRRKNNNTLPPNIENVNNNNNNNNDDFVSKFENHRHVIIGPSNVGITFYMLKVLEKVGGKKPIHIITQSSNQYPNYKTSTEIKPTNK